VLTASDLVSDEKVPIPGLCVPPPRQPSALAATTSLAGSDDEVHILHIPPHSALASCDSDDDAFLLHPLLSYPSPTSLDSLVGSPASVTSVLVGSPITPPQPPPRYRISCLSPQVSCVSGTPDHISDDKVPIPRLHVTSPPIVKTKSQR
jgi:hypothetical protein